MATVTNMTTAQLKEVASTGVTLGQKHQKNATSAYVMPPALMGTPQRPRLQLDRGRSSGCQTRRTRTHATEVQYVSISETRLREMMALKATLEPRLMSASRDVIAHDSAMALTGR